MLLHSVLLICLTGLGAFAGSVAARRRSLKVQDVKRLHLEPGDKVVLRLAPGFGGSLAFVESIEKQLRGIFPDNKVILLTEDHEFTVVRNSPSRGPGAAMMKKGGTSPHVRVDAPSSPPQKPSGAARSARPAPTNPGVATR